MYVSPYLFFDGECAEAFRFYARVTGWRLETLMRYADAPQCDGMPDEYRDRIIHASLVTDNGPLMASDCPPGEFRPPAGFALSISLDDPDRARGLFDALAEGGRVDMPMEPTFFAEHFGMLTDRFGVSWMVGVLRKDGNCGEDG